MNLVTYGKVILTGVLDAVEDVTYGKPDARYAGTSL
jgi:hypothetical protein